MKAREGAHGKVLDSLAPGGALQDAKM